MSAPGGLRFQLRSRAPAIDVALEIGERPVALVGPNGAGKSTVLRMLLGLHRVAEGRIDAGGRVLLDTAGGVSVQPEARALGYVPQEFALFPHLSVAENVAFGLDARRLAPEQRVERMRRTMERFELLGLADRRTDALSGGERQRVALARALVVEPVALLLDEPMSALDVRARRAVREFLGRHLREFQVPALLVTHDLEDAAAVDAHVAVLEGGRIVQQGSVAELRRQPATAFVAELIAG